MKTSSNLINLKSLFDLSATLNSSEDDAFILGSSLLTVMGKLRTMQAVALQPVSDDAETAQRWRISVVKGKRFDPGELRLDVSDRRILDPANEQDRALYEAGLRICVPAAYKARNLALLCFGAGLGGKEYSGEELEYVSLVGTLTATALLKADNLRSLTRAKRYLEGKTQLLTTLFEISREFTTLLDQEEIVRLLTYRLMGQLMVSRFALFTRKDNGAFELSLNRLKITPQQRHIDALQRLTSIVNTQRTQLEDEALQHFAHEADAEMFVPMRVQKETKGVLVVGRKLNRMAFEEEDENYLEALANTAMSALESARLFREELEKKRLEEELNIARKIQQGLLPDEVPQYDRVELAARNIPSKQVGGDYFDIIPLDEENVLLAIADVSGKSTPAALLMANTQAALRALAGLDLPLAVMVARINDLLVQNTNSDKFVTFFCGRLNLRTMRMIYVNAGHNPPMLLRANGEMEDLRDGGIILGVMETMMPYEEGVADLHAGDTLLMYTDGVSEALDREGREFTEARLLEVLKRSQHETADVLVNNILLEVERHSYGVNQSDDITMIALHCRD